VSNFRSIGQGVRGLQLPKIGGFPLTLNVALTTVLRTNVLHCDYIEGVLLEGVLAVYSQGVFSNVRAGEHLPL